MFRFAGLWVLWIWISPAFAQQPALLEHLLQTSPSVSPAQINYRLDQFVYTVQEKRKKKSDADFLRLVLRESYKSFFKTYQPYAQLNQTFESGVYDCLSATSVMSVILDQLGYRYQIIETNYHIFMQVDTGSEKLLLETTDRYHGVISDPEQIQQQVQLYQTNRLSNAIVQSQKEHYQFNMNLYQEVQPEQLPGLLLFNQAVLAYNAQDWITCADKLDQARKIYESPRVKEFGYLLVLSILESELDDSMKRDLIRPFLKYTQNQVLAAR